MEIRETKKTVEVKGRKFILNKFDPFFGSYLSFKVFSLQGKGKESIEVVLNTMMGTDYKNFETLSKRVLKYCSELLPAGEIPIINSEGNISITGLTAPMVTSLFIQSVMFNITDFFEEDPEILQMDQPMGQPEEKAN